MKLRKLKISRFKNLRNFEIDFGANLTTVVLGQNGTGKSNLLEALIIIFRDLDLGRTPEFRYELDYECRGKSIHINADPQRGGGKHERVQITVYQQDQMPQAIPYNEKFYKDPERKYLPSYVFGYYSGPGNRMEKHFGRHQKRFYDDLRKGKEKPSRPLLYARPVHSQFALLSFFVEEEEQLNASGQSVKDFLKELLGIERLVSVLFIMRQPPWDSKEGDSRFWNARGAVKDFLSHLYTIAFAPMYLKFSVELEFVKTQKLEHLYLYLQDVEELKRLYKYYGNQQDFFKALESTYISKILSEVRIRLQRHNADGSLTFQDLSEGEQQLLMVLGLLRFTKEEEALFLLDEPDTHLNPAWGVRYLEFMDRVVGNLPDNQVIMTTHNPLVIASLQREDVRIMRRDGAEGNVLASLPRENPKGMGVAGILTSDLFDLRSSLDTQTQDDLDRRRELAAREDSDLTEKDIKELNELNDELSNLDFSLTARDPLYQDYASEYRAFVREFTRQAAPDLKRGILFTDEQREQQRELTRKILRELQAQRGQ